MKHKLPLTQQVAILLRGSPLGTIKRLLVQVDQHQLGLNARDLECHHLASGDITDLVESLVFCKQHGLQLCPTRAMAQQFILRNGNMTLLDQLNALLELGVRDVDGYLNQRLQQAEL